MSAVIRPLFSDLARLTSLQPDKVALLDAGGRTLTYRALLDAVERCQAWLRSQGLRPGGTVVSLMPNAIETIVVFLAVWREGGTYAPLPCTATRSEVDRLRTLTGAGLCLLSDAVSPSVREETATLDWRTAVIGVGEVPAADAAASDPHPGGRLVLASSGSTGDPKIIALDVDRLWSAGLAFLRFHQMEHADVRFWNYLPMSYLGGIFNLTLIPLAAGGSVFIDEAFSGKTFLTFWPTVERHKINSLWLVPTILRGLVSLARRVGQSAPRPAIRCCYLGTAPVSNDEKQQFFQLFGIQPLENFGLSETTFISSERHHALALRREGTVGAVMPDVEVRLVPYVDDTDGPAKEIFVRTPYQMLGYLDAGRVDPGLDADGFFGTGDCGEFVDGQLQLTGRRRDIIKRGGVMVMLREIELVAEGHPDVAEAAAVRVPHDFYGESYELYVRTQATVADPASFVVGLESWLHAQLVRHKWPERVLHRDDFPRTASGKVQKHLLSHP